MFRQFLSNESGVTAIEYGLIAALIGILLIVAFNLLSVNVQAMYGLISNSVNTSSTTP